MADIKNLNVNGRGDDIFFRVLECFFLLCECPVGERRCASSVFGALFIARALLDGVLEVSNDNFLQRNIYLYYPSLATIFGFTLTQIRGTM